MPFNDIAKLKINLKSKVDELRDLQKTIEERDDKTATEAEREKSVTLRNEITNMEEDINRIEMIQRHEITNDNGTTPDSPPDNNFRNLGEFVGALCEGRTENMVRKEKRDMTASNGPSAGYLIPEAFGGMLRAIEAPASLVRPRATPLGGGNDATVSFNTFDQSGSKGIYGGVSINWINETGTRQDAGDLAYKQVKFEPKEASAYIDLSNKLLRNAPEVSGYIESQLGLAIAGSEDQKFVSGSGVGCPLGYIGHSSSIEVTRNTSSDIKYSDVCDMFAAAKYSSNLVWVANQTTITKLMQMVDAASQLVWQPSAREGIPGTLIGIPVIFSDLVPVLGTKGDLCLCDFSYYGIRDGSPMSMFADPFSQSVNQITRLYLFWNVDGQPLLTSPLLMRDATNTISPFIVLDA
jgi:HK97 family phage major capsid protein